jgi:hypothetical protein
MTDNIPAKINKALAKIPEIESKINPLLANATGQNFNTIGQNLAGMATNILSPIMDNKAEQIMQHTASTLGNLPQQFTNTIQDSPLIANMGQTLSTIAAKAMPTITNKIEGISTDLLHQAQQRIQTNVPPSLNTLKQIADQTIANIHPQHSPNDSNMNADVEGRLDSSPNLPFNNQSPIDQSPIKPTPASPLPSQQSFIPNNHSEQPVSIQQTKTPYITSTYKNLEIHMPASEIAADKEIAKKIYKAVNGEGLKFLFPTMPAPSFNKFFAKSRILRSALISSVPAIALLDRQTGCKLLELDASHYTIRDFYGHCIQSNQYRTVITFHPRIFSTPNKDLKM